MNKMVWTKGCFCVESLFPWILRENKTMMNPPFRHGIGELRGTYLCLGVLKEEY